MAAGENHVVDGGQTARLRRGGRLLRLLVAGVGLLALTATLGGCGVSSAREDLGQALEDTRAAVRSVELAVHLLQHDQTTRAAAEVTAQDMSDEIGKAQRQLVDVPGPSAEIQALRAQTQTVVNRAQIAVQQVGDALTAGANPTEAVAQLAPVDKALGETARAVGGG